MEYIVFVGVTMMKKTEEQLNKDLTSKISGLEKMIESIKDLSVDSDCRIEMSRNIATALRSILYGDKNNNYRNLIERCGLDNRLLFPCYDAMMGALNLLPSYNLLTFSIKNNEIFTIINENIEKTNGHWNHYLTFDSWLNEIVIDTKTKNIEPISRLLLIKIVADTQGAHVDDQIETHLYEMSQIDMMPIHIEGDNVPTMDLEVKANSIFAETIIAIAKELIVSFHEFSKTNIKMYSINELQGAIQVYKCSDSKYKLYKYSLTDSRIGTKSYNANCYYECDIYGGILHNYEIKCPHKKFVACIMDANKLINSSFICKSLYGK